MKPSALYETGDIIFVFGTGFVSKLIGLFTFGKVSHVAIVANNQIYETDGAWMKSKFSPITKYDESKIRVFRVRWLSAFHKAAIDIITEKRLGTPYSYLDVATQALTFFLHPKIKGKLAEKIGNKKFSKCDEETWAVLYEATSDKFFKDCESSNPQERLEEIADHKDFMEVLRTV